MGNDYIFFRKLLKFFKVVKICNNLSKFDKTSFEQGKDFADQYGMKFFETSSKNSINVNEAFITMTKEVMKNSGKKNPTPQKPNVDMKAPQGQSINSGKGCC